MTLQREPGASLQMNETQRSSLLENSKTAFAWGKEFEGAGNHRFYLNQPFRADLKF